MAKGLYRRNVFFFFFFKKCGQGDSVIPRKILQSVVDDDWSADDF
jgi:hypothetical protein